MLWIELDDYSVAKEPRKHQAGELVVPPRRRQSAAKLSSKHSSQLRRWLEWLIPTSKRFMVSLTRSSEKWDGRQNRSWMMMSRFSCWPH